MSERLTTDWRDSALCAQVDPDTWFPERGGSTKEAKMICARCRFTARCLQLALDTGEIHGVWGGTTEKERRKMRKAAA
jgi:WhiB family redox-sensing transcriptional regulator